MWSWLHAWSVVACAGAVVAQHHMDQEPLLAQRPVRMRDRDRAKPDEPTCEQLKAMWRFSKRQARAPEIMNEVSSYRDPLMYNEWPVYAPLPRLATRYRYPYPGNEAYGRVVTKAPPNVVRTPDYDEMFGMLNGRHSPGKMLRFSGPSRPHGVASTYMVPPQRNRFEILKNLVRQEHALELQRQSEAEQKEKINKELKQGLSSGRSNDDYAMYQNYGDQEQRGLQALAQEYADEPSPRHSKKPPGGNRQVNQFSRYSDVMLPPSRRTLYTPTIYAPPELMPYVY